MQHFEDTPKALRVHHDLSYFVAVEMEEPYIDWNEGTREYNRYIVREQIAYVS